MFTISIWMDLYVSLFSKLPRELLSILSLYLSVKEMNNFLILKELHDLLCDKYVLLNKLSFKYPKFVVSSKLINILDEFSNSSFNNICKYVKLKKIIQKSERIKYKVPLLNYYGLKLKTFETLQVTDNDLVLIDHYMKVNADYDLILIDYYKKFSKENALFSFQISVTPENYEVLILTNVFNIKTLVDYSTFVDFLYSIDFV
jgi:hypothetical protein